MWRAGATTWRVVAPKPQREGPMRESFDILLKKYEDGRLARREFLAALTVLAVPAAVGAQGGRFRARALNHVNIGVTDVSRSEAFLP